LNSIVSAIAISAAGLALLTGAAPAFAQDQSTSGSAVFDDTGVWHYSVPPGVRTLHVEAVGGRGAARGSANGGSPLRVI